MMPTGQSDPTYQELSAALKRLKRERWVFWLRSGLAILAWFMAMLSFMISIGDHNTWSYLPSLVLLVSGVALAFPPSSKALLQLQRLQDMRSVGPLVEMLEIQSLRRPIHALLMDLLPRLKPENSALLNTQQRAILCRELAWGDPRRENDFLLAILKALEQIGNEQELPFVRSLAEREGVFSWQELKIQEAARNCLPFLQIRIEQQRVSRTLLRPVVESAAELLRPAAEQESVPEHLLRAASSQKEL